MTESAEQGKRSDTQGNDPIENETATDTEKRKKQLGPQDMGYWDDIVGQRVNEAMKQGKFDNLRGRGKPLKLRGNPMAGERQLAYDLMEDNDIAPQWIGDRKAIQQATAKFREEIQQTAEQFRGLLAKQAENEPSEELHQQWHWYVKRWSEQVAKLNDQIQLVNFQQPPVTSLELIKLRLSDELKRAGVGEEL